MNINEWKWLNESMVTLNNGEVMMEAGPKTDWFINPVANADGSDAKPIANAPILYQDVTGDFVFSLKAKPNHIEEYDAISIMVIEDESMWTKLAFEATDFNTKAVVCVVTNGVSDDANGCDIEENEVWLKMVRVGNVFSTHFSRDGVNYQMVRLFRLEVSDTVKVGFGSQSPKGEGINGQVSEIKLETKTVTNLRKGK